MMARRVWTSLGVALGVALALGCAAAAGAAYAQESAPAENAPASTPESAPENTQCIFFNRLYDWTPINNTNLILWASRTQSYHVQVTPPCIGLPFANAIGFTSRNGSSRRLCIMDALIVNNGPGFPERCLITSMDKLDDDALQALLAQAPGREQGRNKKAASEPPQ